MPVAVVTGGGKGIGRSIATRLAHDGYSVAILDPLESGASVAQEIETSGGQSIYLGTDVSDEEAVLAAATAVEERLGPVDALVNNAGIFPRADATEMPYALWLRVLSVNLGGAFLCSRTFAPTMLRRGHGAIVNIASGRALQGAVRGAHYSSSKSGLLGLTRTLALEWAPTIRVNTIIPGITDTDQPREELSDAALYAMGERIPLGRIGQPDDIAKAVRYLLSDEASYITGASLCVNGGAIMP
jgi:NAD(P)-dependent dehydrogenase (short-subunit alcohol dehydrogenase family)